MGRAAGVSAGLRVRGVLGDPVAPFLAFAGLLAGAVALGSPVLAWAALAGLAGYSLSGST